MIERQLCLSRRVILGMIGAAFLSPRLALATSYTSLSGSAFGTTWHMVGGANADLDRIRIPVQDLFTEIDRQMSPWREDSTLSRFNSRSAGWFRVEYELARVLELALSLARQSNGLFDPTVGPLVAKWGFGPIRGGGNPDWQSLSVSENHIAKASDDLTIDLCGIAKGWALDRAVELARKAGLNNILFDLGGELRALGDHPSGRSWQVAIQNPRSELEAPALIRLPAGSAVATSGLQTQSYSLAGRAYGHIVDPRSRRPSDNGLQSVTVIAPDATTADGWATALFVAGKQAGLTLARQRKIAAYFLVEENGSLGHISSEAMRGLVL